MYFLEALQFIIGNYKQTMHPVIASRPVGVYPPYVPAQSVAYQPPINMNSRVAVHPVPNLPPYVQGVPHYVQPNLIRAPVYPPPVQTMSLPGYMPPYQPVYVPGHSYVQPVAPYYAPYIPPVPINPYMNSQAQMKINPNFDYQSANFLTQAKIVQSSVFCVICGSDYKASEKQEHLKKHMRKPDNTGSIILELPQIKPAIESKVASKKQYITKPLVQPEQHTIPYEPLVYEIVQEVVYEDSVPSVKDEAIGEQPYLSDGNISFEQGNSNVIPKIKTQANPFFSKGSGHYPGNSLNEPVPFMSFSPELLNSINQANGKMGQSILSDNKNLLKNEQSKSNPGSQLASQSVNITQPKKDMIFTAV